MDTPAESVRGNFIKKVGDTFSVGNEESPGVWDANFRVTAITVDPQCTGEYPSPSENGHFVRFDIEGETTANFAHDMYFGGWRVVAENGTTFNGMVDTSATFSCLDDAERLPVVVGAGERVSGAIILDVPTSTGVAVLPLNGVSGWEWAYPQ